jgi:hypothetical protein
MIRQVHVDEHENPCGDTHACTDDWLSATALLLAPEQKSEAADSQ